MDVNTVTDRIIGAAIEVHRALGPGLLESAYEACMVHELAERRLMVERQKALPVKYKGVSIDERRSALCERCAGLNAEVSAGSVVNPLDIRSGHDIC
ncbi:MAG: GxxExxY protein [Gemmatimonadetes bacterium]|nr:GxxExxY protein [Gemmatimonadota bacterium]